MISEDFLRRKGGVWRQVELVVSKEVVDEHR